MLAADAVARAGARARRAAAARAAELVEFEVTRGGEATFANVYGVVAAHPPSTERIDLVGAWSEPVDDLAEDGPRTRTCEQVVFSLPLAVAATGDARQGPHEQPYTLFDDRFVSFHSVIAMGRGIATPAAHQFSDQSAPHALPDRRGDAVSRVLPAAVGAAPRAAERDERGPRGRRAVQRAAGDGARRVRRADAGMGHRGRRGRRRRAAAPRRRSARVPVAAVVLVGRGRAARRRRRLSADDAEELDDYPFVTLIGRDPIRAAAPLEFARAKRVRNAVRAVASVELRELPGTSVTLVCFDVRYDDATRRWFCDIELDTELAYMPFVRLSLVRYQEHALARCSVSAVVLCDLVQPLPDRTLTVVRDPADPAALAITLAGPSYEAIRGPLGRRSDDAALGRVVARLEARDPSIADDELGWIAVEGAEVTLARAGAAGTTTWSGTLALEPDDGLARRVAVIEYDHLAGDEDSAVADGLAPRVVYADAFAL